MKVQTLPFPPFPMTLTELVERYPVRNVRWHGHWDIREGVSFTLEASDHIGVCITDPWNRRLPTNAVVNRDPEGDITHWDYTTSVAGNPVKLTIFND